MHIPVLRPHTLHLWRLHHDASCALVPDARGLLLPEEEQRAQRMSGLPLAHYRATRIALRRLLCTYAGVPAPLLRFHVSAAGKPCLPPPWTHLQFNISHAGAWSLLAFRLHEPVGIDVERIRSKTPIHSIARRFFTAAEADAIEAAGPEAARSLFFRLWTRKEALVKARGSTMLQDAGRVAPPLSDEPSSLSLDGRIWHICSPCIAPGYAAALATPVPVPELVRLTFEVPS